MIFAGSDGTNVPNKKRWYRALNFMHDVFNCRYEWRNTLQVFQGVQCKQCNYLRNGRDTGSLFLDPKQNDVREQFGYVPASD